MQTSPYPPRNLYIGCAGWSLPSAVRASFPPGDSQLQRYAGRFRAVEINSSFYRPHQPATYARWAACVPAGFLFTAKFPREITHFRRLADCAEPLDRFLGEVTNLGDKLGCLLLQLPPSLAFTPLAEDFLGLLRARHAGAIAVEARHASWFEPAALTLLERNGYAGVAADPALLPLAAQPHGGRSNVYFRLHGSPRMYYSGYEPARLDALAERIRSELRSDSRVFCIFDNTAAGAAVPDALALQARLDQAGTSFAASGMVPPIGRSS